MKDSLGILSKDVIERPTTATNKDRHLHRIQLLCIEVILFENEFGTYSYLPTIGEGREFVYRNRRDRYFGRLFKSLLRFSGLR